MNPHPVFDYVKTTFGLKNDRALCQAIDIDAPTICKIRNGVIGGRDPVALAIHETFGISFATMRALDRHFVPTRPPKGKA